MLRRVARGGAICVASGGAALGAAALYTHGASTQYAALSEDGLPLTYDPAAISAFWSGQRAIALHRVGTIGRETLPFGAAVLGDWMLARMRHGSAEAQQELRAVELRELLTRLGPTFIKFGQMLSIRPDLLPQPVITELQKLCDAVPSYPAAQALALIEQELGAPAADIFEGLGPDTQPIAAASLGQVYRCRLRASGEEVALKVQRPDMLRAVSLDLYLLRGYMVMVEAFKARVLTGVFGAAPRKGFDVALLDTFAGASYRELDYEHEAHNQQRMAKALKQPRGSWGAGAAAQVYVPRVHWEVTSRKVLASEWIEGEQLARSSPATIRRLVPTGVDCFLCQLLQLGFFHSDPHPGNLLVDERGRLVLIDFGLCAEVQRVDSAAMTRAIVNLMRGDVEGLLEDAITLRFLPRDVDREALLPELRAIFAKGELAADAVASMEAAAAAQEQEVAGAGRKPRSLSMAKRRAQFSEVSRDLNRIFYAFPFAVPEYFALITRALIVLEGIALTGDANFDIFRASYPYATRHAASLFGVSQLATMLGEAAMTRHGQRMLAQLATAN